MAVYFHEIGKQFTSYLGHSEYSYWSNKPDKNAGLPNYAKLLSYYGFQIENLECWKHVNPLWPLFHSFVCSASAITERLISSPITRSKTENCFWSSHTGESPRQVLPAMGARHLLTIGLTGGVMRKFVDLNAPSSGPHVPPLCQPALKVWLAVVISALRWAPVCTD